MEETIKNKLKSNYYFSRALIFSIAGFLLPFVAAVLLGLAMGLNGVPPPCQSCDDPNISGQALLGFLMLGIFGFGALLMLLSELLSIIYIIIGFIKKELREVSTLPIIFSGLNVLAFIVLFTPRSPFLILADFIATTFFGCKCYGYQGG